MSFTEKYKDYFNNIVKSILKNLNNTEYDVIFKKYCELIDYIYLKFLIKDESGFYEQLKRNNNQEIIAILYLFFPYIEDTNNYEKFKLITKLSDITLKKNNGNYEICNFQYSRGYYDETSNKFNEYPFSIEDININFELLKQSIERLRIKLYVNWVNIVPILLENYKESQIYKDSEKYYLRTNSIDKETLKEKDTALPIAEIYDTLVNELYMNTLDFKWLLFEKSVNKKIISYIDILDQIYPVYNILNDINGSKWLLLDENKKELFTKNMDLYFSKAEKNITYNNISAELLNDFFKNMLLYFDTKYKYVSEVIKLNKGYRSLIIYDVAEIDVDDDYENKKTIDEIFNNYKNIDKYYLYDFIRLQIIKLSKTWYGFKMFQNNKIIKLNEHVEYSTTFKNTKYNDHNIDLSYKNIYNFSKCLFYFTSIQYANSNINEYIKLTQTYYYANLNIVQKKELDNISDYIYNASILDNVTNFNYSKFFNIGNNISIKYKEYGYRTSSDIFNINRILFYNFNRIIFNIVFECLCKRGILSEYIIRKEEFELKNLNQNNNEIKKKINQELFKKHLQKYENANYYLNDDKYKNLPKIYNNKRKTKETYFERLLNFDWYNFYAMDWVSQINFYHHYMNQRIVMLTGGTGVGKSTQTPKLLLYGLKAFDKKFDGKVICTQPRIAPTINNASTISRELGVDIQEYNKIYKKTVKTTNGIIQYKYEKDDHIDEDLDFYLRIVTDGSLLIELKKSPLLKQSITKNRSEIANDKDKLFSFKNIYDIVIIDESHEHNANMDLILSIVRGSLFLNNQLRLYIVSATMDADDPIYRKYYRAVNDNLKYPIRDLSLDPIKNTYNLLLDRIVIDRRIHISPPGETTQYRITEIYNDKDFTESEEQDAYKLAIKYAQEICVTNVPSANSDILLFCTTSNKIIKLVDELNKLLPLNTIAIPFYKDLPEESKNLIATNLYQIKKTFKFERKDIHSVLNLKVKPETINSVYKYDRVLIVSTNIAEASITINSLKYVIDTGFNLDVSYNYTTDTTNIQVTKISEASRLQRKGRVGRVGDGIVYYTYPKDSRLNIMPTYNICKVNFGDLFLQFLEESSEPHIYNHSYYPYIDITNQTTQNLYEVINYLNLKQLDDYKQRNDNSFNVLIELFKKFIINQYATTIYILKDQVYTESLYNIDILTQSYYQDIVAFNRTGISNYQLIDPNLGFFLIHPFEYDILKYRDENTRILKGNNKSFENNGITKIINDMVSKKLISPLINNLYVYVDSKKRINKIKIVEYLHLLKQKTDKLMELNLFYPIIAGYKLGIFENILFIVYFLYITKYNLMSIVDNIQTFTKFFSSKESDLLVINKIFELFKAIYAHILFESDLTKYVNNKQNEFKKNFYYYINKNYYNINNTQYDDIVKILLKNDDIEKHLELLSSQNVPEDIPEYIENDIKNWCKMYGINFKSFMNLIKNYKIQYCLFKYILDNKKYNDYIRKSLINTELSIDSNIIKSFLHGNINNIFIYEGGNYMNFKTYGLPIIYKKNTFYKKWITNVNDTHFILVLNKENEIKINSSNNEQPKIDEEQETENGSIILNILSSISSNMYSNIVYFRDNPTNKAYYQLDDINHNFICNNPINIDHNKHPDDPKFNEYLNILKISMKEYIDRNC